MKKIIFTLILTLLFMMTPVAVHAASGTTESEPKSIDPYTQVYDLGNGNYRLILQTDTQKNKGEMTTSVVTVALNPLLQVTAVEAKHSKGQTVSAIYDEANHTITWNMHILDGDANFFSWPINYLVVDFKFNEDVYGDILIFEESNYTVNYQGSDSSFDHTFHFWQNAIRVEGPQNPAEVSIEFFKDAGLTEALVEVHNYNTPVYVKLTVTNPNADAPLLGLALSVDYDMTDLAGTTASGADLSQASVVAGIAIPINLNKSEVLTLSAKMLPSQADFIGDQFSSKALVTTVFPGLYVSGLNPENILGSGQYIVLKTENQMKTASFQAPYIEDEDYGWTEGLPFKTAFDYNHSFSLEPAEEGGTDSDEDTATLVYRAYKPPVTPPATDDEEPPVEAADVTVHHVDEDGNILAEPVVFSGELGEAWTSSALDLEGWVLFLAPDVESGVFTSEPQSVTYVYETEVVLGDEDEDPDLDEDVDGDKDLDEDEDKEVIVPPTGESGIYLALAGIFLVMAAGLAIPAIRKVKEDSAE